jgi:hypothetical protein
MHYLQLVETKVRRHKMTRQMIALGLLFPAMASLLAQGHGHRVPSVSYSIGAVDSVFHVRFVGDGVQPAELAVLEYQPSTDDNDTVDVTSLPGAVPGVPSSFGNNHWIVGSVTCGATGAARQAWITRVHLLTAGGQCTGVQVVASVQCGSMDPYRLIVDPDNQRLWMIDAANGKLRVAPYDVTGPLPAVAAWADVGGVSQWSGARAFLMAMPQAPAANKIEWWSPWEMVSVHQYVEQSGGGGGVAQLPIFPPPSHSAQSALAKLATFSGLPAINTMQSWTMTTLPGVGWSLNHPSGGAAGERRSPVHWGGFPGSHRRWSGS